MRDWTVVCGGDLVSLRVWGPTGKPEGSEMMLGVCVVHISFEVTDGGWDSCSIFA